MSPAGLMLLAEFSACFQLYSVHMPGTDELTTRKKKLMIPEEAL